MANSTSLLSDKLIEIYAEALAQKEQRFPSFHNATELECNFDVASDIEIAATILNVKPQSQLDMRDALEIAEHLQERYVIVKRAN